MKSCYAICYTGLSLLLLLNGACRPMQSSPLQQDLGHVKPGMSLVQVEAIMGKYLKQNEGNTRDPRSPDFNPMGGINKKDIPYPLEDKTTSAKSEQRTWRARTRRGDWEYAFIDFQDGRVVAVHLLR